MNDQQLERLNEIRNRLSSVRPDKRWKYNPQRKMFIGTTNAIEMYERIVDLGRDDKEWEPYEDETGRGYRLTEASKRNIASIQALGEFLENCREDLSFLLGLADSNGDQSSS